jgi:hypothetical protein
MIAAVLVALVATFSPFYVGPHLNGPHIVHRVQYARTPADGVADCRAWLDNAAPGTLDCLVEPDSMSPDPEQAYPGLGHTGLEVAP